MARAKVGRQGRLVESDLPQGLACPTSGLPNGGPAYLRRCQPGSVFNPSWRAAYSRPCRGGAGEGEARALWPDRPKGVNTGGAAAWHCHRERCPGPSPKAVTWTSRLEWILQTRQLRRSAACPTYGAAGPAARRLDRAVRRPRPPGAGRRARRPPGPRGRPRPGARARRSRTWARARRRPQGGGPPDAHEAAAPCCPEPPHSA